MVACGSAICHIKNRSTCLWLESCLHTWLQAYITHVPCLCLPQNECQVSLNTIDSLENFVSDINAGRWDVVLPQVAQLKLPRSKLEDLYEQVTMGHHDCTALPCSSCVCMHTRAYVYPLHASGMEKY